VVAEGTDQLAEIALHDLVELVEGETDPMIGDPVLRVVVRPDLLRAIGDAGHPPTLRADRRVLLLALEIEKPAL